MWCIQIQCGWGRTRLRRQLGTTSAPGKTTAPAVAGDDLVSGVGSGGGSGRGRPRCPVARRREDAHGARRRRGFAGAEEKLGGAGIRGAGGEEERGGGGLWQRGRSEEAGAELSRWGGARGRRGFVRHSHRVISELVELLIVRTVKRIADDEIRSDG
uniref:Uncharacterized protein n=1 Tax=Oryza nivara TaxID=4536 RepID=A0A0E0HW57_ORYNI